jgi:hypothetical protein
MSKEYFELAAVLLGVYGIFRVIIWLEFRAFSDIKSLPPSERSNITTHAIDTSRLVHRLEDVRREFAAEARAHPPSPKKPLLVEERRAEIAKLAFFQKPTPEPEPPDQGQGLPVLLAL